MPPKSASTTTTTTTTTTSSSRKRRRQQKDIDHGDDDDATATRRQRQQKRQHKDDIDDSNSEEEDEYHRELQQNSDNTSPDPPDVADNSSNNKNRRIPTQEQNAIISNADHNLGPGQIIRVTAAAGTGKTTTLEMLAERLVRAGRSVLYIVYNRAAQDEAQKRFVERLPHNLRHRVRCQTMHACALASLRHDSSTIDMSDLENEEALKRKIYDLYADKVIQHIRRGGMLPLPGSLSYKSKLKEMSRTGTFYIFKTLEAWWRSKSHLSELLRSDYHTYYPCKKKHQTLFGIEYGMFYVRCAHEIWTLMWTNRLPVLHDAYLKRVQLDGMTVSEDVVLLDESQDTNECQIDLFVTQQVQRRGHDVYVVGDAVQTIYSFRGARSKFLVKLAHPLNFPILDYKLTQSFRFGPVIASIANQILFMKENSPQGPDFHPYRVQGLGRTPGTVVQLQELDMPFTVIGRTNIMLFMRALSIIVEYPHAKVAVLGSRLKFTKDLAQVKSLWVWSKGGAKPKNPEFADFEDFEAFRKQVEIEEMGQYVLQISMIYKLKDDLPNAIKRFEEMILSPDHKAEDSDIILSTVHQAKGLEFDNVEVLDDLIDLQCALVNEMPSSSSSSQLSASFQSAGSYNPSKDAAQFDLKSYGDDLNLWYVAVTRAKNVLHLPEKWWILQTFIKVIRIVADRIRAAEDEAQGSDTHSAWSNVLAEMTDDHAWPISCLTQYVKGKNGEEDAAKRIPSYWWDVRKMSRGKIMAFDELFRRMQDENLIPLDVGMEIQVGHARFNEDHSRDDRDSEDVGVGGEWRY